MFLIYKLNAADRLLERYGVRKFSRPGEKLPTEDKSICSCKNS